MFIMRGFLLSKRLRETGELILSVSVGPGEKNPTPERISDNLRRLGWSYEAVKAALWFLFFRNIGVLSENLAYKQISLRGYGVFRAVITLGVILGLKELHPIVAVLKVYFEKKDVGEIRRTIAAYNQHFASLPQSIQAKLSGNRQN
jgi:hypothetical protein